MFFRAKDFNQPLAAWDVGQVTTMHVRRRPRRVRANTSQLARTSGACARVGATQEMFEHAWAFNQPVAAWDVGKVVDMKVRHRLRFRAKAAEVWLGPHAHSWLGGGEDAQRT